MEAISKEILGIDLDTLKSCNGLNTAKEIAQQPKVWIEAIHNLHDNKDYIKNFINNFINKKTIELY